MQKSITFFAALLFSMIAASQNPVPQILWSFQTNDASFGQSCMGDIDNDGKPEIVFGCYRNDSCVYALNAENGTLLWKYNTHTPGVEGCNDVAPIIYDVDNDGSMEVIVPASCNPTTFCFNGADGSVQWTCPTRGSDSPPTIEDVDNDGKPEILHGEFGGYVICINAENGTQSWEIAVDLNSWIQTAPTITDLNNDGQLDFVVATWNSTTGDTNKVYAYRGDNHSLLWTYPINDVVYHGTTFNDLDNDGKPELALSDYSGTIYVLNGEDGSLAWDYCYNSSYYCGAPVSMADLDGDGACELVFSCWFKMGALRADSSLLWTYDIPGYESAFRGAALADLDEDQLPDLLFGTSGGLLIAVKGTNGSLIWTVDLRTLYGNSLYEIDHAPVIGDFDQNGVLDAFIVGGHAEYPAFSNDFGRGYAVSLDVNAGPEWPMFQYSTVRNASLCDESAGIENVHAAIPALRIFPNPASGSFRIEDIEEPVEITVTDITGKRVFQTKCEDNARQVSVSSWPGGIYILQVTGNRTRQQHKLIVTE